MEPRLTGLKRQDDLIRLTWSDELVCSLKIRDLRIGCPCAFCVNEISGERMVDPAEVPQDIGLHDMQPVGRYAYRLLFDDGHDTGLYTLEALRSLCQETVA